MSEISIIVPVYNCKNSIEKCVNSIMNQTYKNIEIILVDDGSSDGSGEICDRFTEDDSRITVVHQQNKGLSGARNAGIEVATSPFLYFIDSDDYISTNTLEIMYDIIIQDNVDIVIGDYKIVKNDNIEQEQSITKYQKTIINKKEAMSHIYDNKATFIVAWNKLYRKEIFSQLRYPLGRIHEDNYIIHRIYDQVDKVIFIDCQNYYYVQGHPSIINSKFSLAKLDILYALKDRFVFFGSSNYEYLRLMAYIRYLDKLFNMMYKLNLSDFSREDINKELKKEAYEIYYTGNYRRKIKITRRIRYRICLSTTLGNIFINIVWAIYRRICR